MFRQTNMGRYTLTLLRCKEELEFLNTTVQRRNSPASSQEYLRQQHYLQFLQDQQCLNIVIQLVP